MMRIEDAREKDRNGTRRLLSTVGNEECRQTRSDSFLTRSTSVMSHVTEQTTDR